MAETPRFSGVASAWVFRAHRFAIASAAIFTTALATSCGGGSTPSQPSPTPQPPTPPAPAAVVVSGTLTATNGGQQLAGATVDIAGVSNTADSSGHYSVSLPTGIRGGRFAISGPTLVTHNGFVSNGDSRTIDMDAFALDSFDQPYFRAIVRNGFEDPTTMQPLRRWTRAPMIYLRTIDDTGSAILPEVLQQVVSIVADVIPQYTHGRFGVAGIEQGTDTRRGQAGWITVEWTRDATEFCGQANVGLEGGRVTLTYDQPGCSCGSQKIRPRTVKHEFGHAMGLWHTGQGVDLMSGIGVAECDRNMTARELRYLEYLYRRPVGNTDPDNDPSSAPLLRAVTAIN